MAGKAGSCYVLVASVLAFLLFDGDIAVACLITPLFGGGIMTLIFGCG